MQAVVNFYGPTDMETCYQTTLAPWIFRLAMDGTPNDTRERYKAYSPINYVTKNDAPVLTIHGDKDILVSVDQAKMLDSKMQEVGLEHELLILPGQNHGFDAENQKIALDAMWTFFAKHLKPAP